VASRRTAVDQTQIMSGCRAQRHPLASHRPPLRLRRVSRACSGAQVRDPAALQGPGPPRRLAALAERLCPLLPNAGTLTPTLPPQGVPSGRDRRHLSTPRGACLEAARRLGGRAHTAARAPAAVLAPCTPVAGQEAHMPICAGPRPVRRLWRCPRPSCPTACVRHRSPDARPPQVAPRLPRGGTAAAACAARRRRCRARAAAAGRRPRRRAAAVARPACQQRADRRGGRGSAGNGRFYHRGHDRCGAQAARWAGPCQGGARAVAGETQANGAPRLQLCASLLKQAPGGAWTERPCGGRGPNSARAARPRTAPCLLLPSGDSVAEDDIIAQIETDKVGAQRRQRRLAAAAAAEAAAAAVHPAVAGPSPCQACPQPRRPWRRPALLRPAHPASPPPPRPSATFAPVLLAAAPTPPPTDPAPNPTAGPCGRSRSTSSTPLPRPAPWAVSL
jgi:hypothetical protein